MDIQDYTIHQSSYRNEILILQILTYKLIKHVRDEILTLPGYGHRSSDRQTPTGSGVQNPAQGL